MTDTLEEHAKEESTYIITAAFTDEDAEAVIPDSVEWSLLNPSTGAVINSREDVSETPAASVDILLYGDDLVFLTKETNQAVRELVVNAVYDSVLQNNLPLRNNVRFIIDEIDH